MSQQINLFNPIFRKKRFSYTSAIAMVYGAGVAVAVTALAGMYADGQLRSLQSRAQAVEQAHKEASATLEKLAAEVAKQKPNPQLAAEIAALETQLGERREVIETLKNGTVGNTEGFSDYLRAFSRQSVSGLWLTAFDIAAAGNALALQGRTLSADHVATFLKRLNQEEALQGRPFAAMRISQPPPEPKAEKTAPGQKDAKEQRPAPPRYLEFTISTMDIPEGARSAARSSSIGTPLLGPLNPGVSLEAAKTDAAQARAR